MRKKYRAEEEKYQKDVVFPMPSLEQETPMPVHQRIRLDSPEPGWVTNPIDLTSRSSRHSETLSQYSRTP